MRFFNSVLFGIVALLGFSLAGLASWWHRLDLAAPPAVHALLATLVMALMLVLLGVALWPVVGRLRNLRSKKLFHWICPGALVPLLLVFFAIAATPRAEAQAKYREWTSFPTNIGPMSVSNLNNNAFTLLMNRGVGVSIQFTATNAAGNGATTNLTIHFDTSPDGTNWTRGQVTGPLQFYALGTNGPTSVLVMTNLVSGDIARLNGTYQIRPRAITNNGGAYTTINHIGWVYNND
jgi:hypothetical protein